MNIKSIESNVIELTQEVGSFIRTESQNFDRSRIEQKEGFNNLVSYVDKESEKRLVNGLSAILPGSGFIGEEGTNIPSQNDYTWVIDPLDGTTNFTHGLPPFSISIGLLKNQKPVLGVVYEVMLKECFYASEGNGAHCNGAPIRISGITQLSESLLATGFPYQQLEKMDAYLEIIRTFLDQTHGIRRLGSAAVDLAYVACGRLDGFFEYNLNPWDVAAGGYIVEQAGGRVTDFQGGPNYLFGRELCAGGAVQPQMQQIIKNIWG